MRSAAAFFAASWRDSMATALWRTGISLPVVVVQILQQWKGVAVEVLKAIVEGNCDLLAIPHLLAA